VLLLQVEVFGERRLESRIPFECRPNLDVLRIGAVATGGLVTSTKGQDQERGGEGRE
jgi:hypothetical protein